MYLLICFSWYGRERDIGKVEREKYLKNEMKNYYLGLWGLKLQGTNSQYSKHTPYCAVATSVDAV